MNFNPHNSTLLPEYKKISANEYLNNLFVKNWSTQINYEKYFEICSSSKCTYSTIERTELLYAITLFISLYGGLTIILRPVASFSIDIIVKRTCFSNVEQNIRQQKLITRVYLILLIGKVH